MPVDARTLGHASAVGLLVVGLVAGCADLTDPRHGVIFDTELLIPDTIPLGGDGIAQFRVTDGSGRRVTGIPVAWAVEPHPHYPDETFHAAFVDDSMSIRLQAVMAGAVSVLAYLNGKPAAGAGDRRQTVWSAAQGIAIHNVGPDREVVLEFGQDTVLRAHLLALGGVAAPQAGSIEWVEAGHQRENRSEALPVGPVGDAHVYSIVARAPVCQGRCADTVAIRVIQVPDRMEIHGSPFEFMALGEMLLLYATLWDRTGHPIHPPPMEWSLLDPADTLVVTLEGGDSPRLIARGNGTAHVVAAFGPIVAIAPITVHQYIAYVWSDRLPALAETPMAPGAVESFVLGVYDPHGSPVARPFTLDAWSTDTDVLTVTADGHTIEITAVGPGTAELVLQVEGASAAVHIVVE